MLMPKFDHAGVVLQKMSPPFLSNPLPIVLDSVQMSLYPVLVEYTASFFKTQCSFLEKR